MILFTSALTMLCRILLADDHPLFRAGVRLLIEEKNEYAIVGEAGDGDEAITLARSLKPDIILMDVAMKRVGGVEALKSLSQCVPEARVLMLSSHAEPALVVQSLEFGACGYLLKDATLTELELALAAIRRGERYLCSAVVPAVIEHAVRQSAFRPGQPEAQTRGQLTQRQVEILRLIARGESTRSIAAGLGLSVKTVEAHRAQIMQRLRIHDVASLVLFAVREGIIQLDD